MKRVIFDTNIYGNIIIDEKSMLSINAIREYNTVNEIKKLRTPDFINYEKFKRLLL